MITKCGKHCQNVKMQPTTLRYELSGHVMVKIGPDRWVGAETAHGKAEIARLAAQKGK
jgi:hypothetical protein